MTSRLIRIGGDAHLDIIVNRAARRCAALRSRRFAGAFTGFPDVGDPAALHKELALFGPLGCRLRFVSCDEVNRHPERFVPDAYGITFAHMLRKRFEPRVRSACGVLEGMRIWERFGKKGFEEPVPQPDDAFWAACFGIQTLAYFRFVEMRGGPGYPMTRRLAKTSLLFERMVPLGTLWNEPREWQVLVLSTADISRFFP